MLHKLQHLFILQKYIQKGTHRYFSDVGFSSMHLQKLVLVHALSGFGHSTMSVILPVVSAMGIQGCPLPTAVFSNHTGFPSWHKVDLTDQMEQHIKAWDALSLQFDGIYSGYLGTGTQAQTVLELVKNHPEAIFFLDPVMGDHGRLYSAITKEHVQAMKELTRHAQYILPNITEACILTDTEYQDVFSDTDVITIMRKLHAMGPSHIVITGIHKEDTIVNYFSQSLTDMSISSDYVSSNQTSPELGMSFGTIALPVAGTSRPGTGDIFGAVLISSILKGQPLKQAVLKAAQFVADCIKASDDHQLPAIVGTCFEQVLPTLLLAPDQTEFQQLP